MAIRSKANKRYFRLYVGFVSGPKYYTFNESNKSKVLALKRKFDLENVYTELTVIEPKSTNTKQMSFFETI